MWVLCVEGSRYYANKSIAEYVDDDGVAVVGVVA